MFNKQYGHSYSLNNPSIRQALNIVTQQFIAAKSDAPRRCAQALLAYVLGVEPLYLGTHPDKILTHAQWEQLCALSHRHEYGEPLAYLLGYKEFYGRNFLLNTHTLIPRPESEDVLDAALSALKINNPFYIDIGTGSGCIGLSLAAELPQARGILLDLNIEALLMAKKNARKLDLLQQVQFVHSDLRSLPISIQSLDLIISNPPYISEDEYVKLLPNVRNFEPHMALVPQKLKHEIDSFGLLHIEYIAQQAYDLLNINGVCIVEHGYLQGKSVYEIFAKYGQWSKLITGRDLSGLDRYCLCIK